MPRRREGRKPRSVSAEQTIAKDLRKHWHGMIPEGFVTLIGGNPSQGKSLLSYLIAAEAATRGPVLFASFEETREHVWKPRVQASGGDESMMFMHPELMVGTDEAYNARIIELVEDIRPVTIIIDPVMNHTQHTVLQPTWVRRDFSQFSQLIERERISVVLLHHVMKSVDPKKHPLAAFTGSLAGLPSLAKACYLFSPAPHDQDTLVLANAEKFNFGPLPTSRAFQIDLMRIPMLSHDGKHTVVKDVPYLQDLGETDVSARALLPVIRGVVKPPTRTRLAMEFLVRALEKQGFEQVKAIREDAVSEALGWRTVEEAGRKLGVRKEGRKWFLPDPMLALVREITAQKALLGGEHAETHLTQDEVDRILADVSPN